MENSHISTGASATNTKGVANNSSDPAPLAHAQQDPFACEPEKKKKRTVGNIIYDFGVFGSIAWLGVAALSAVSAHEAMHGTNPAFGWWRNLNNKVTDGLSSGLSKTILKNASAETVHGYAKGTTMFLTLGMGGNLLMGPLKWLEDNRQKNAAAIDNLLGTTPPDADMIAHEPKQTWKSVLSGRVTSWGLSYAAFLAMGPKLTGTVSDWFGKHATDGIMKVAPGANPANVRKWSDIAAFDALFTVITASITYAFSRYIAKKGEKDLHDDVYDINRIAPTSDAGTHKREDCKEESTKTAPRSFSDKVGHAPTRAAPKPVNFSDRLAGKEAEAAQSR